MPRNAAGVYALPLPPVVAGNTIMASFENTTDSDIASELTNSLDRNGRGGMLAPFKIADGTAAAPGIAFTQDPDNGFYRIGADHWGMSVGGAQVLDFTQGQINLTGGATLAAALPQKFIAYGSSGGMASAAGDRSPLAVVTDPTGNAAFMSFNRAGSFGAYLGLDSDNTLRYGGWSHGDVAYRILHEGNSIHFEVDNFHLNTGGRNITAQDIYAHSVTSNRGDGTGVYFFGGAASRYLLYDGADYVFAATNPLRADAGVAVGMHAWYPLVVKCAANMNMAFNNSSGVGTLGCISDPLDAWQVLGLFGPQVIPAVDNACHLGAGANRWIAVWAVNGAIQTSDARQKKDIKPSTLGLAFIDSLTPVEYTWITEENEVTRTPDHEEVVPERIDAAGNVTPATTQTIYRDVVTPLPGTRPHWGLIAQEVRQAVQAAGIADGFVVQDKATDLLGLNYGEFVAPLVKAVQELSAKVAALEAA